MDLAFHFVLYKHAFNYNNSNRLNRDVFICVGTYPITAIEATPASGQSSQNVAGK
jgi:hypothetical protein